MLDDSKYRSPYYGMWFACLVMIVIPFAVYGLLYLALDEYQTRYPYLNEPSARALGFCVGTVFDLMCFVCGAFSQHIAAVIKRIFGFFGNLKVSLGFAFQCYFEDIKNDGAGLIIVLAITAATAFTSYTGLREFLSLWNP